MQRIRCARGYREAWNRSTDGTYNTSVALTDVVQLVEADNDRTDFWCASPTPRTHSGGEFYACGLRSRIRSRSINCFDDSRKASNGPGLSASIAAGCASSARRKRIAPSDGRPSAAAAGTRPNRYPHLSNLNAMSRTCSPAHLRSETGAILPGRLRFNPHSVARRLGGPIHGVGCQPAREVRRDCRWRGP